MKLKLLSYLSLILISSFVLSACNKSTDFSDDTEVGFSNEEEILEEVNVYSDSLANAKIDITQNYKLNQEFKVQYLTKNPAGQGSAQFKARSLKEVDSVDERTASEGNKLVLVEISVRGDTTNKGEPSTFNQIGDNPSPQFVLIDQKNNRSYVEETYYSDVYTKANDLFELSKITLDHDQWVNTALVFEIPQDLSPVLAFRFTNLEGQPEFYAIQ